MLDDSTLDKPFSKRNALVYRHWSGKHKEVVSGINLITLLWTDGDRAVPCDYRIFDKDTDGKTKNDHFSEMLIEAHKRGFAPKMVCFDSWYSSIENLKLVRGLSWHFLTRLKANRQVHADRAGLQAVSEIEIPEVGRVRFSQRKLTSPKNRIVLSEKLPSIVFYPVHSYYSYK